jgi:hypothetical protein
MAETSLTRPDKGSDPLLVRVEVTIAGQATYPPVMFRP